MSDETESHSGTELAELKKQLKAARGQARYWENRAKRSEQERDRANAVSDLAYAERNALVAFIAHVFPGSHRVAPNADHYPAERADAPRTIIRPICCIHMADWNFTWHFSPTDAHLFADLPEAPSDWDGHTTRLKYERLVALGQLAYARQPCPSGGI